MRIAQVAPLYESVPPKAYGGTERVVHFLTEELVRLGHEVTLFASGDSDTSARLLPQCETSLRLSGGAVDGLAEHVCMIEDVVQRAREFDVVHFHIDHLHFPVSRAVSLRQLTTLHGRLDLANLRRVYDEFADMPVVSISDAQRTPLPQARWIGTVHHGLPAALLPFQARRGDYFAFVGRISPEKRVDRAIAIATALQTPLRIAAKVDPVDRDYFTSEIEPLLDNPLVDFVGEIGEAEKGGFIGNAKALLFPIDWPEPFGLVMIEAAACGTPVVAFRHGSVPEVMVDGVTGYVVDTLADATEAARAATTLDRARIRAVFENRFTATRMAKDYLRVYKALLESPDEAPEGELHAA